MFRDRRQAGRMLVRRLGHLRLSESVILGVPRGGVPVATEIAQTLSVPLDVVVVGHLTLPERPARTLGALTEDGIRTTGGSLPGVYRCRAAELAAAASRARDELSRMASLYRAGRTPMDLHGCTAVVVDDGVVSADIAWASCRAARARGAQRVVFATPVISPDAIACLSPVADECVRLAAPPTVRQLSDWYERFPSVSDADVVAALEQRGAGRVPAAALDG